ncbi:MAG: hypothetical protein ACLU4J_24930 [Butyricimonas paravirosa]
MGVEDGRWCLITNLSDFLELGRWYSFDVLYKELKISYSLNIRNMRILPTC